MSLFSLPPKQPQADLDLEFFLKNGLVAQDNKRFKRMLAPEWFPQSAVQLTWPHAGTDWLDMLPEVIACYKRMAYEIAIREPLLIVAPNTAEVKALLEEQLPQKALNNIIYKDCPTNDTWARDHGFLTVVGSGSPELLDFQFNGWGGKFDAEKDNAINKQLFDDGLLYGTYVSLLDFELEGGSIESDGCGTLLTTSECLLNPNRNHTHDKTQLTMKLEEYFGATNVLWLDYGYLAGDDTDSHIDTLARLCPNNRIVYVRCDDSGDEHYEALRQMEAQLRTFTNAENKPFELIPLPMASAIYEDGERLPATYANYLVVNHAVLYPTYSQPENDEKARKALHQAFPHHDLVGIDCCALIRQHGSLHCSTMQFPKGVLKI